jgi:hypothetical protein
MASPLLRCPIEMLPDMHTNSFEEPNHGEGEA